jgi:large subunit ribosomal protein L23
MLLIPRVSEKAYALNMAGTYVFTVPMSANKAEVMRAIEREFKDTKVKDIKLVVVKGKAKAARRGKRVRPGVGMRSDFKKAYITLSSGKIEVAAFKTEDDSAKAKLADKSEKATLKESTEKTEVKRGGLFARRRTGRRGDK